MVDQIRVISKASNELANRLDVYLKFASTENVTISSHSGSIQLPEMYSADIHLMLYNELSTELQAYIELLSDFVVSDPVIPAFRKGKK